MSRIPGSSLAVLLCLALASAACSSSSPQAATAAAPSASAAASSAPPAPPPPPVVTDPLTGRPGAAPAGPVVVVKVDNEQLAQPFQRGLEQASVVYEELMEGGSTRLAAVFTGAPDLEVGPVRSARESDLELFAPYGPVMLAYSGANSGVLASVRAADIVDASYDRATRAYRLGEQRADARNFFVNPARIATALPGGATPTDVGLRFGAAAGPGQPTATATIPFSSGWTVGVRWDAGAGLWQMAQNGAQTRGARAANVVIQQVQTTATRYRDVNGAVTPYSHTIGSGPVTVLRDGMRLTGTWSRPDAASKTTYTTADGSPLTLAVGQSWVLLQPREQNATFG